MASTSSGSGSSDESSKAPEKFHVSSTTSNEDICVGSGVVITTGQSKSVDLCLDDVDGNGPTSRCLLCGMQRRYFNCRSCVKTGSILNSAQPQGESLMEKQQRYIGTQANLKVFRNRYEQMIQEKKTRENIEFEIKNKKEQLKLITQLINEKRLKLQKMKIERDDLQKANDEKRKNLPHYPLKLKTLENFVFDRIENMNKLHEKHDQQMQELKKITRHSIQQVAKFIFPISEIVLKETKPLVSTTTNNDAAETIESETIAALADAKNTSYIRGKWVFHGSGISEMQYRIVGPSLPANGDYTAYLDWLSDNKNDVTKATATSELIPSRVNAYRISGALTYTTQLVQLMSYFLNVRLPYKLAYGDFCKKLDEEQFSRKVSRLNSCIMYLAYTQRVQLRGLNINHTLENILNILDVNKSDLGRHGYHEVINAPLAKSVDSLLFGIETESESEDENSLRLDWESVGSLPTQLDIINAADNLMTPVVQQSTVAEGLMTSAANRITSILRWMK